MGGVAHENDKTLSPAAYIKHCAYSNILERPMLFRLYRKRNARLPSLNILCYLTSYDTFLENVLRGICND